MLKARDMLPTPLLRDLISSINVRIVCGCRQLTQAPYTRCEVISISCVSVWRSVLIGSRIDKRIRHANPRPQWRSCEAPVHDAFVGLAGAGKLGTTSASPSITF